MSENLQDEARSLLHAHRPTTVPVQPLGIAESDAITVRQWVRPRDTLPIDERPVGAAQILDIVPSALRTDLGVRARDQRVLHDDVVSLRRAADAHRW